jgi:large conductance mechanosensitive channel
MAEENGATRLVRGRRSRDGFKKFLLRGNLVDLAVAVVIGAAFGTLVKALVTDFITPLIAAAGGRPDFNSLSFTLHHSRFAYGDFINNLVAFLIVAFVVYHFVVLPVGRLMEWFNPTPEVPPATKDCELCLSKIPIAATVCAFCTNQVAPLLSAARR